LARPDLVLIDGGLGQLAAAIEGLKEVGEERLPVIGLAKARGEKDERVYLAGRKNPVPLKGQSPATHLLQRIRDEAHRFAVSFHRALRGKALLSSKLDQIIGIGEIRRARLLKRFGSVERVAAASDDDLRESGIDERTVAELRKAFTDSR
jgi:excinuclease ABC subunit C